MVISIIYDTMWLYKTNNDIFHFCENYSFNAHYVIEHKSHWNDTIKRGSIRVISSSWTGSHTWEWTGCNHAYLMGFLLKRHSGFWFSVQPITNNSRQHLWSLSAIKRREKLLSPRHDENQSIDETEERIMDELRLNIYW